MPRTRQNKKSKVKKSSRASTKETRGPVIQFQLDDHQLTDIWSILFLLAAAFVFATFKFPNSTGFIGQYLINDLCAKLFGESTHHIPLFLIFSSVSLLVNRSFHETSLKTIGLSFVVLTIVTEMLLVGFPTEFIKSSSTIQGGGFIGRSLLFILHKLVGPLGTKIILFGGGLLTLLLIFKMSFYNVVRSLISSLFQPVVMQTTPIRTRKNSEPQIPALIRMLFFKRTKIPSMIYRKKTPSRTKKLESTKKEIEPIELEFTESAPKSQAPLPNNPPPKETTQASEITISTHNKPQKTQQTVQTSFDYEDDTLELGYQLPPQDLLQKPQKAPTNPKKSIKYHQEKARQLEEALQSFKVNAKVINVTPGPSVTRYELQPGKGVKVVKITNLANDIALKLAAQSVRIQAPIPGKSLVGIEVPNDDIQSITLSHVTNTVNFYEQSSQLLAGMGVAITGEPIIMDIGKMPHVLIAGATGSGKSVCINTIIISILMRARPDEVKFLMIDPKQVELSLYNNIPHLLAPVVSNPNQAATALKCWALQEMERRYTLFSKARVKSLDGYNKWIDEIMELSEKDPEEAQSEYRRVFPVSTDINDEEDTESFNPQKIPYIVVIIDELADLMMVASKDVETTICRLAQMARATGIHLVIATQRPSVNVITGLIKANIPSRISFFLQSQVDSRTVLDMAGAEKLLGKGDMLYSPVGTPKPIRAQGVYLSEKEIKAVVKHVKSQAKPTYLMDLTELETLDEEGSATIVDTNNDEDDLYDEAKELVINAQYASTSYLQRKLRIGYNRAARIMDSLKENGIIDQYATQRSPQSSSS